jgi:hypothetical protein
MWRWQPLRCLLPRLLWLWVLIALDKPAQPLRLLRLMRWLMVRIA